MKAKMRKAEFHSQLNGNCIHIFFVHVYHYDLTAFIGFVNKTHDSGLPNNTNTCKNVELELYSMVMFILVHNKRR